jgi:hypothetical protein
VHYEDETRKQVPCGIVTEQPFCDEQGNPVGNVSVFESGPHTTEDGSLAAAAPDLAQTIAGMREEWRRETRIVGDEEWAPMEWRSTRWYAENDQVWWWTPKHAVREYRLVRRLISAPEVIED